jgi:hypothetical protein
MEEEIEMQDFIPHQGMPISSSQPSKKWEPILFPSTKDEPLDPTDLRNWDFDAMSNAVVMPSKPLNRPPSGVLQDGENESSYSTRVQPAFLDEWNWDQLYNELVA